MLWQSNIWFPIIAHYNLQLKKVTVLLNTAPFVVTGQVADKPSRRQDNWRLEQLAHASYYAIIVLIRPSKRRWKTEMQLLGSNWEVDGAII